MALNKKLLFSKALKRAKNKCEYCGIEDSKATKDTSKLLNIIELDKYKESSINNSAILCLTCKYKAEELQDEEIIKKLKKLREPINDMKGNELEDIVKEAFLKSQEFEGTVENEIKKMRKKCINGKNEATRAAAIERCVGNLLKFYNVEYEPEKEGTVRVVNDTIVLIKGRKKAITNRKYDSRFLDIITEYKVDIMDNLDANKNQLKDYIQNIDNAENNDKYFGVLTDGIRIVFITYENGNWEDHEPRCFNVETMKELLRVYLSLERKKFTPEQLVIDFSLDKDKSEVLNLAQILYNRLEQNEVVPYHQDWQRIFKLAGHNDNNNQAILERQKVLSEKFRVNVKEIDETKALFTLQTSYCILIKLIAYKSLCTSVLSDTGISFDKLKGLESERLRTQLSYIEGGGIFKQLNINNLLEKDFFSWYLEEDIWNEEIYEALNKCISVLQPYDVNQRVFTKEVTHDLFNDLYQSIIPKEVRHSLGEYYTMDWLADSVIEDILEKETFMIEEWRGLDPCCGSGAFIMRLVNKIIEESMNAGEENLILTRVLKRVVGMDINPLAVLTCSVNYFIAISPYLDFKDLISNQNGISIPILLGDAALKPKMFEEDGIQYISYIFNEKNFIIPKSIIRNKFKLDKIERYISEFNMIKSKKEFVGDRENDYCEKEIEILEVFLNNLFELVKSTDNRIWVRTIVSILKCQDIGEFDIIVSNPPWIDWKVLPDDYREVLKVACLEKHVFSGDNYTGGINLNICALIANVVADNWLKLEGYMGLLMPKSIALQQSYKGFRELKMTQGGYLAFHSFVDWSNAGNPFNPVTEKFMTYYFKKTKEEVFKNEIICKFITKKKGYKLQNVKKFEVARQWFDIIQGKAVVINDDLKNFLFIKNISKLAYLDDYKKIVGESYYKGRVGLGLYPKGRVLFNVKEVVSDRLVKVENNGGTKTLKEFIKDTHYIESSMLYPVLEGPDIERFGVKQYQYVAALPYAEDNLKTPIKSEQLERMAPRLFSYYDEFKVDFKKTDWNKKLQGNKGEFYSITRVGKYTFAPYKVAFRNNTKWVSAVVSNTVMPWGEEKMYLFLDHACLISQREDGTFISEDEAHYICAILNSNIVKTYIENSSDSRSFKTIFPIKILRYEPHNEVHKELSDISKKAHNKELQDEEIDNQLNSAMHKYLNNI